MTLKELTEMDDIISRWEAFKAVMDDGNITNAMDSANDGEMHRTKRAASRIIAGLPSAQRMGKWIDIDEQSYTWKVRCSVCGHERSMMSTQGIYPNYCENCGAKMDAKREL